MWVYLVFYINFYLTSYPTYVIPEHKQAQFIDKWEAVDFMNRAIDGGCDSVRMDSIYSDNITVINIDINN